MYTQCPECRTLQSITEEELNTPIGMTKCETCSAMFDAQESFHEGTVPSDIKTAINDTCPQPKPWGLGTALLLLVLIFQVYFFEAYNLSQYTKLRPWLKKACSAMVFCQFPDYRNTAEFTILKSSFEPENAHYIFNTAFINQSIFAQKRPSIQLTLIDFTGRTFAKRLFHPVDYSKQAQVLLEPNILEEITLTIATPSSKVGGYRIKLI